MICSHSAFACSPSIAGKSDENRSILYFYDLIAGGPAGMVGLDFFGGTMTWINVKHGGESFSAFWLRIKNRAIFVSVEGPGGGCFY